LRHYTIAGETEPRHQGAAPFAFFSVKKPLKPAYFSGKKEKTYCGGIEEGRETGTLYRNCTPAVRIDREPKGWIDLAVKIASKPR
jgi:hypothetical protein